MYKYILDKSSKKYFCPNCNKKRFVRFVEIETNELLPEKVGRCDRDQKCGYFLSPIDYFKNNGIEIVSTSNYQPQKTETTYHNISLLQKSGRNFKQNNFIQYLKSIFNEKQVKDVITRYFIGTSKYWFGATVFWQLDKKLRLRGGKIMLYNKKSGKRIKKPHTYITWVHSILLKQKVISDYNLSQCLFGLHLVNEQSNKPIAIVESEKTACIMSEIYTDYQWLACGSLTNISDKLFFLIKNKKIILYPDASFPDIKGLTAFDKWNLKAKKLIKIGYSISVSKIVEESATKEQKQIGYDIADYYIYHKLKEGHDNEVSKILTADEAVYSKLIKKNPSLKNLVNTFDLQTP